MTKNGQPGHYTMHATRKYQCNGRVAWGPVFRRAASGAQEGDGIRAALAYAVGHAESFLTWAKGHPGDWQRAPTTPGKPGRPGRGSGRPAKRAGRAKGGKGGKGGKAAKRARPAKRAPEQLAIPEVK